MVIGITTLALFCVVGIVLASSGEAGGTKGWVATDTYRVMNFTVLAVALFLVMRKPVSKALNARIKGIEEHLVELEAKKKEAEKQLAAYNEKFATLEQEADKLIDEYIRQGNEAKERILAEAQAAAEKLEEQARRNIEHEFKQTKLKLQEEILVKALAKAEELIKSKISAQDHEKLVEEYLEKVVA
jgi:F-type H+-transporting ATPase subunit b